MMLQQSHFPCWALLCAALSWSVQTVAAAEEQYSLQHLEVRSFDGVPLNVVETGNPDGETLLLLHGFSQSYLSWHHQLHDQKLLKRFRIVAFDLRGHGGSGKPWTAEAYAGHMPWAEDVHSVIKARNLGRPIVVGWSFGGYVAIDYIRAYGQDALRGLVLVGSHGGFLPRQDSTAAQPNGDLDAMIRQSATFMGFVGGQTLSKEMLERGRFSFVMLPDYVRRAMIGKQLNNTDLSSAIRLPIMFVLGGLDASVPAASVREKFLSNPNVAFKLYEAAGHSPFADDPEQFAADVTAFASASP